MAKELPQFFPFFLIISITMQAVLSWTESQTMIVATIARNGLIKNDMFSYYYFDGLVKSINFLVDDRSRSFIQASCWANDVERNGFHLWGPWRKFNEPILQNHDFKLIQNQTEKYFSLERSLNQSIKVLKSNVFKNRVQRAFFARYLLNLVASAHDPLSCTSYYNETFPKGDKYGQLFQIFIKSKNQTTKSNLKNFFNQILFPNPQFPRPLTPESLSSLFSLSSVYVSNFSPQIPISQKSLTSPPSEWISQSISLSNQIYQIFYKNNTVDLDQEKIANEIQKIRKKVGDRVVLAGLRLGKAISGIYHGELQREKKGRRRV